MQRLARGMWTYGVKVWVASALAALRVFAAPARAEEPTAPAAVALGHIADTLLQRIAGSSAQAA